MTGPDQQRPAAVDLVIVSYNSREHLRPCLESALRSSRINAIVVDNASHDDSLATVTDLPVTVIAETSNAGFGHGCNRGWRAGQAPFVLFLNPDCVLAEAAVEALVAVLERPGREGQPEPVIVGPRLLNEDGSLALSQNRFPRLRSTFSEALYLHRIWRGSPWANETVYDPSSYERSHEVEWLSGACLLVRRSFLELVGGFDEGYFMYSEDAELCRAAWRHGFTVRFEPAAVVQHAGGKSAPRTSLLPVRTRSRVRYVTRNESSLTARAHRAGFALEAITHSLVGRGGWPGRVGYAKALREAVSPQGHRRGVAGRG